MRYQAVRLTDHPLPLAPSVHRRMHIAPPCLFVHALLRTLAILELVQKVTGKAGAVSSVRIHVGTSTCLQAENAVSAVCRTCNNNRSLPGVRSCGTTMCSNNRTLARVLSLVIGNCLGSIIVDNGGTAAILFEGLASRRMLAIEAAMFAKEFIICGIGLVSCTSRKGVRHCKGARHVG
jgi:hypothetical protein